MPLGWIGAQGGAGITTGSAVRARPVWVDLDIAFPLPEGHRPRVVAEGIELSGRVPGMLKRWVRGARGEWLGLVHLRLCDGAGDVRLVIDEQLVPAAALAPRAGHGDRAGDRAGPARSHGG